MVIPNVSVFIFLPTASPNSTTPFQPQISSHLPWPQQNALDCTQERKKRGFCLLFKMTLVKSGSERNFSSPATVGPPFSHNLVILFSHAFPAFPLFFPFLHLSSSSSLFPSSSCSPSPFFLSFFLQQTRGQDLRSLHLQAQQCAMKSEL